jgi:hypothetical protein
MVVPARTELSDTVTPLEALLDLTRCAGEQPVSVVLASVAQTLREVAGFEAVVVNIYRPA